MATAEQWLAKLAKLRVDRASGDPAPHKPLLLLTILELAEQGLLPKDVLPLTPEFAFRFFSYANVVVHRDRPKLDIRLPFHHLEGDGIWSPLDDDGKPSSHLRDTRFAALTSDFVAFVSDPASRDRARRILIATYFRPTERIALYEMVGMRVPSKEEIKRDAEYRSVADAKKQGREQRFRITVVSAYNYACALTDYRLTTITAGSIVDAAHIHQFADSRNNDPRNGIALSKNSHWLFYQGLWSLTDDYRVIVAVGRFAEERGDHKALGEYHGQKIRLPKDQSLWPNPVHFAWHRKKKFQGA